MSSIIAKPFDPTKKIDRIVYRGAPALMNTEDINRNEDSQRYYLDNLAKFVPLLSDITLAINGITGSGSTIFYNPPTTTKNLQFVITGTYVIFAGARLTISPAVIDVNEVPINSSNYYHLCLYATRTLVTAEADPTKTISGIKFADGSSNLAASHYVWSNEQLVVKTSLDAVHEGKSLVACLSRVYLRPNPNAPVINNEVASLIIENFYTPESTAVASMKRIIMETPLGVLSTDSYPHVYKATQPTDTLKDFARVFNRYVKYNSQIAVETASILSANVTNNSGSFTLLFIRKQGILFVRVIATVTSDSHSYMAASLASSVSYPFTPFFHAEGTVYGYTTAVGNYEVSIFLDDPTTMNWFVRLQSIDGTVLPIRTLTFSLSMPCIDRLLYEEAP